MDLSRPNSAYIIYSGVDTKRTVAKRIRMARVERDLTQGQLAQLLNTTQTYITKLEKGKTNIGVETVAELSRALRKPISYFFEPFEEEAEYPKEARGRAA